MSVSGHVFMDADVICGNCDKIVRPLQTSASADLTCPFCEEALTEEVQNFNERYGWGNV